MICPHCEYSGLMREIYFSAGKQIKTICCNCGKDFSVPTEQRENRYIKGFCGDCDLLEDNDLGIYCGKSLEDVNPVHDYCSFWEAKDDQQ